jgi:predicted CXXCH cytochrome family protein
MGIARLITGIFLCACGVAAAGRVSPGFSLASETATYVGDAACARCHEAIAREYAATPMARTSGLARADFTEAVFTHPASGVHYRMVDEGGKAFLEYERGGPAAIKGKQELQYYIGSNAAGRSYLFSADRYLFQSPVTYYAQSKRWGVSPGYESDLEMRWNRPVDANCLFCHSTQSQPIYGTQNRFADPPFKHGGVSCERCHGPGSLHAQGKAKLVNPGELDPARRDSVCAQCHLSGEARVALPGKGIAQFRPGEKLADYVTYFVFEGAARGGLKVNSHVENMAQSMCKRKSGDRMSCLSCHDPHSIPKPQESAAWFRGRCLQCHRSERMTGVHAGKPASDLDCAGCHMPKSRAVDGGHGVMTDHSVPLRGAASGTDPEAARKTAAPDATRKLIPFPGYRSDGWMLGLAYAEVATPDGDKSHEDEALRLLSAELNARQQTGVAKPAGAVDGELFARLGFLYGRRGDAARAARAYETALRIDPGRVDAMVNLGGIYAGQGRLEEAEKLWREALLRNAGLTEASINLARLYFSQKKLSLAREILTRALRFDPDSGQLRQLLREARP